jgi:epoxyqueuosine reductase
MTLSGDILSLALDLGFDAAAIAPVTPPAHGAAFTDWLASGYHGEMAYLAARAAERLQPLRLAPGAQSMIVTLVNYHPGPPPAGWDDPRRGRIARYTWSRDYHDAIKRQLFRLDAFIRQRTGRAGHGKACVDTAPLLERDAAEQAGLGFAGRNTCLITPGIGSWTFLAALFIPEALAQGRRIDAAAAGRPAGTCGACTRCLDRCPTAAFPAPHVLDARRCISYLTIELRGSIPRELRPALGNRVFGCDVCQEVCPYNRAAPSAAWSALAPDLDRAAPPLAELLALDEARFRARFRGTAVLRARRRGLVRSACVAAGNAGDPALIPHLTPLLEDVEPIVRGHAAWALGRIGGDAAGRALDRARRAERDAAVLAEIAAAH